LNQGGKSGEDKDHRGVEPECMSGRSPGERVRKPLGNRRGAVNVEVITVILKPVRGMGKTGNCRLERGKGTQEAEKGTS